MARRGAAVGALSFACMPLTWLYSTHAEVFSMNNALLALLLLLLAHYLSTGRSIETARRGCFVIGLGMCNQHTFALCALPGK